MISIHPPRVGRDDREHPQEAVRRKISIHPPRVGRDVRETWKPMYPDISIHPPRVGRDRGSCWSVGSPTNFNPPAPGGAGLLFSVICHQFPEFQSTRPGWGGTEEALRRGMSVDISIHPPRVGRDDFSHFHFIFLLISIHPPRVGRDLASGLPDGGGSGISIHPPRVGRDVPSACAKEDAKISIHPPRVGRDIRLYYNVITVKISIHPPRVGRDFGVCDAMDQEMYFNPPAPGGAGPCTSMDLLTITNFNPPAPGGAGPGYLVVPGIITGFQSTRPGWGGTQTQEGFSKFQEISIHPPRVGRDYLVLYRVNSSRRFQSTRPGWGGTRRVIFVPR